MEQGDSNTLEATQTPGREATPAPTRLPPRKKLVRAICVLYLAGIIGVWLLLWLAADRWWAGTLAMFAPTWAWALPLVLLIPLAALLRRRMLWPLGLAVLIILFPISRFCIPWRMALRHSSGASGTPLRIVTLNADHRDLDPQRFANWIKQTNPDLVVLQAWRSRYESTVFAQGWHLKQHGNLCLASRHPIVSFRRLGGADDPSFASGTDGVALYEIALPSQTVRVANVHLTTPREGLGAALRGALPTAAKFLRENTRRRLDQSRAASTLIKSLTGPVIIAGDFNSPTTSAVYRECWSADWTNAFSHAGWGSGHTHFTRRTGARLDHVLVNGEFRIERCRVGPDVGSAHRPVIAELLWLGPAK